MVKGAKPFINIGPGQIIKREMESLNWSQEDLAEIMGMSPKSISQMINNKQGITTETALLLSKTFSTSPEFWLNLEQHYRLRLAAMGDIEQETEMKAEIRKHMPLLQMKKKGWISFDRSASSQKDAYCRFWNIKEPDFSYYSEEQLPLYARQAKEIPVYTGYYTQTWLRKARIEASEIDVGAYNPEGLNNLTGEFSSFTKDRKGIELFIKALKSCGVKFMVLSHLEKTYLDGAAFMDRANPVIVYTGRYKNFDSFWWTMAHELAHVVLHLQDENACFLDNLDDDADEIEKEQEADRFAGTLLQVDNILKQASIRKQYFTERHLLILSRQMDLEPSIVLGILQHENVVPYRTRLNGYKFPVLDSIPEKYVKG